MYALSYHNANSIVASVGYKASCVEKRLFKRVLSTDVT